MANIEGKANVAIIIDDKLPLLKIRCLKNYKRNIAPIIKGGGGGQKTLATAGGQDVSKLKEVIEKVKIYYRHFSEIHNNASHF